LPLDVLKIFFEREVALPFFRFRMLSRLSWNSPVHWEEYTDEAASPPIKGIWIKEDPDEVPDIVVYYVHGEYGAEPTYVQFKLASVLSRPACSDRASCCNRRRVRHGQPPLLPRVPHSLPLHAQGILQEPGHLLDRLQPGPGFPVPHPA